MCRCIKWLCMQSLSLHRKTRWRHHKTWTWLPCCARAEPAFYWCITFSVTICSLQFNLPVIYWEMRHLSGTICKNCRGFPNGLSTQKAHVRALRKGESKFYRQGNLVASVWKDTKLVCFLSTQSNPVGDETVNRKQHDGSITQVPTISYNKNMGGVDLNDQQRQRYAVGCKSRKWWRYLQWFLVDVSIGNAHILEIEADNHPSTPQLQFWIELAKTLAGDFSCHLFSVSEWHISAGHWPVKATKGLCKRCLKRKQLKFCRMVCTSCYEHIYLEWNKVCIESF